MGMSTVNIPVYWALNSPAPMLVSSVEDVMGKELAHWELIEANRILRNKLAQQEALAAKVPPVPEQDAPTTSPESHKLAVVQMKGCIAGAIAIMAGMTSDPDARFNVTLRGHVDANSEEGIESRTQVFVDQASEPRKGWPKTAVPESPGFLSDRPVIKKAP